MSEVQPEVRLYPVNEIFYSVQGEGLRAGTPNVFVRFAGCNQTCSVESHGFDCDTEFVSHIKMSAAQIVLRINELWPGPLAAEVILTGGEPCLSVDEALTKAMRPHCRVIAIETNGSMPVPKGIDWITVSPKVAEHAIKQMTADEVKYVRNVGQGIPKPACEATHYLISPATKGDMLDLDSLAHCLRLVKDNPQWRLSVQQHKTWRVR